MKTVNIHDAKTHLSALLVEIEKTGQGVMICRSGRPVADLVPHRTAHRLTPHPQLSCVELNYDPTEPLSADEWPMGGDAS